MRRLHRVIGILLLLPFIGWTITGAMFFLKPGYAGAYDLLTVRTYPIDGAPLIRGEAGWLEVRYFRTTLGPHLLVRTDAGWTQLNPNDGTPRPEPTNEDLRRLLVDAVGRDPQRYGELASVAGTSASTTTGVELSLDWNRMSLQQRGPDTERIDWLYRIHYLQWTGVESIDRVAGGVGLLLVALLTGLGARLAFRR